MTSAGTTTLNYDYEGRITSIAYPSGASNSFTYNGLDTRVGKTDSAGTATYKRDGVGVTAPVLSDGFASYTSGVSERRSGTSKFYGTNHLGTTTQETSSAQAVTATKTYDAFGLLVSNTGSSSSPFGFAGSYGYQEDGDSGLKLLGHRYYDPSTGRFLTRDPIKDGQNWYRYCTNNPHKQVDPLGKCAVVLAPLAASGPVGWVLIGIVAVAVVAVVAAEAYDEHERNRDNDNQNDGEPIREPKPQNQVQKDIERGEAPKTIDRADPPHRGVPDSQPHIHNKDGGATNIDGSPSHNGWGRPPTNAEIDWFDKIGWPIPRWPL